jgi:N-acyl-D-aspartate/D-glutamate deacylase
MLDLLIRGGAVIDGTGAPARLADVGVRDGRIVAVGRLTDAAHRTLDADGLTVTPGFVDIHTHYDGQASWDETFSPSCFHGVTTLVMGNCGVGFAPVQRGEEARLVSLMEGVEEIPGAALAEGVRWGWTSLADYARALDALPHAIDFMTLVPHDCLRLFVMGDRAARGEAANADDRARMQALLHEALAAGAAGFSTGRTDNHRTSRGEETPASQADRDELLALAGALRGLPYRVMHAVSDFDCARGAPAEARARFDTEYRLLEDMARAAQRPLALTWLERLNAPPQWQWLAAAAEASARDGIDIRLQAACRAIGVLNGLDTTFNVLMAFPSYQAIAHLPRPERAARLRDPQLKARMLAEPRATLARDGSPIPPLVDQILSQIEQTAALMFPLAQDAAAGAAAARPNYEPAPAASFAFRARARGTRALEALYDYLAEGDGGNLVYFPIFNYLRASLDTVHAMLTHPQALLALSDGGAHVGTVCDASFPTTLLAHWARDRAGARLAPEQAVHLLTGRNARHMGLADRGLVAVGQRADLNLIDPTRLAPRMPELVRDLPAGGRRFVQHADGYRATLVAGELVVADGALTGARPGRWVRAALS